MDFLAFQPATDAECDVIASWMDCNCGEKGNVPLRRMIRLGSDAGNRLMRVALECRTLAEIAFRVEEHLLGRKWREEALAGRLRRHLKNWNNLRGFLRERHYSPILFIRATVSTLQRPFMPNGAVLGGKAEDIYEAWLDRQKGMEWLPRKQEERIAKMEKGFQDDFSVLFQEWKRGTEHLKRVSSLKAMRSLNRDALLLSEMPILPGGYLVTQPLVLDYFDAGSLPPDIRARVERALERLDSPETRRRFYLEANPAR